MHDSCYDAPGERRRYVHWSKRLKKPLVRDHGTGVSAYGYVSQLSIGIGGERIARSMTAKNGSSECRPSAESCRPDPQCQRSIQTARRSARAQ